MNQKMQIQQILAAVVALRHDGKVILTKQELDQIEAEFELRIQVTQDAVRITVTKV